MKRGIAILGSTGSIGTQALEVIRNNSDRFEVEVLTAHNNVDLLISQAVEFLPNVVVISRDAHYEKLTSALSHLPVKIYCGTEAIEQVVAMESIHMVLTAMVGFAGLKPTIAAIEAGKAIALANKETMVVAGKLIMDLAKQKQVPIIPVDSEHSAIFQCLVGEYENAVEKIILTASGGPFLNTDIKDLRQVKPAQALDHPNWCMGRKITIDSATMMNKGLEVIEAKWLFHLDPEQIEVVIHPQSIIHSLVQFRDGSMKAQMGLPDMRLPIQYALAFPERISSDYKRFSFADFPKLDFQAPDYEIFRNLAISFSALEKGGNQPCLMNAANEVAVDAFLKERIGFLEIPEIIEKTLELSEYISQPGISELVHSDRMAREIAEQLI
ncbi:MAG: 1-deoxy-D-xylulose-5-phosphate reductoisomerase [Bacteroidales bacterium]|nr:1-deoxy-D-xylulose-5-phosphate reductoisomerase [Bacteroidales bacterium]MDT8432692.1 1-deoxy-D-xylulose-5-phosphate reductoisomerase [Bacteroidales bacterium]